MIDPLGGPAYLWPFAFAFAVGYLLGSVPFGLLIVRSATGEDVRRLGSGNIGATNVLRTGRRGLALATLAADLLKGFLPAFLAFLWLGPDIAVLAGLGAVLGHCFPVWLGFKGGKGVATAAGVILALTPLTLLLVLLVFAGVFAATRYVSLASILAALAAPPVAYLFGHVQAAQLYVALALIVVVKHYANIGRLLKGTESRTSLGKK